MYCDADFAGLWSYEDPNDPTCVKSRTGYIVYVGGCPIIWGSKLQSEIALSSCEAEYYALSYSMKQLLPLHVLTTEVCSALRQNVEAFTNLQTRVHEDNAACLILANLEPKRTTPRTKHFAKKYHWFRSKIGVPPWNIKLIACDTKNMAADIMTKGLRTEPFQRIRKLVCGW